MFEKPKSTNDDSLLGVPNMTSDIAAGADLLNSERAVSTDVLDELVEGDTVSVDCGNVRYTLAPTSIDDEEVDTSQLTSLFRVLRAETDQEDAKPRLSEGSIIIIDGSGAMPTGTMMKPKQLVRNGYLVFRKPLKAEEKDIEEIKSEGVTLTKDGYVKLKNGKIMWNPSLRATEAMYHVTITKSDGATTTLF